MSDTQSTLEDPTQDPAKAGQGMEDYAQAIIRRQIAMLDRLAEMGMTIAALVEQEAKARGVVLAQADSAESAPESPAPDAAGEPRAAKYAMAFYRAARAVRMTLALQAKLVKQRAAMQQDQARWMREQAKWRHKDDKADMRAHAVVSLDRIERVRAIIRRTLKAQRPDDLDHEVLLDRIGARLWDQDITESVLERPMGELVAQVCKDLDLTPDWEGWAEEAWGMAEILTWGRDSPFVPALAEPPPDVASASASP